MASQKISELTALTVLASGDYFPVVQSSDTSNKRAGIDVLDSRYTSQASGLVSQETANAALASGNAALSDLTGKVSKAGDVISGTVVSTSQSYSEPSVVVSSGVILLDFSSADNFEVTLEGNSTLAPSVSPSGGQTGSILLRQDGTGSRTLAYSGGWSFSNGSAPTLTVTPSGVDLLAYYAPNTSTIVSNLLAAVSGV